MTKYDYSIQFDANQKRAHRIRNDVAQILGANESTHRVWKNGRNEVIVRFDIDPSLKEELFQEIVFRAGGAGGIKCLVFDIAEVPEGQTQSRIWDPYDQQKEQTEGHFGPHGEPFGDLWDGFPGIER